MAMKLQREKISRMGKLRDRGVVRNHGTGTVQAHRESIGETVSVVFLFFFFLHIEFDIEP